MNIWHYLCIISILPLSLHAQQERAPMQRSNKMATIQQTSVAPINIGLRAEDRTRVNDSLQRLLS